MHKRHRSNSGLTLFILFFCTLFSLYYINNLYSGSVDVAHVYALIYRLNSDFVLNGQYDPSLGEMNFYPQGSHLIAVIVGKLLGSVYLGMQFTAFFSSILTWVLIFSILSFLPRNIFLLASFLVTIFSLFFSLIFPYPIHGDEIVSNFFYSQSVGFTLGYLCICFSLYLGVFNKVSMKTNSVFIFMSSYILEYFHLLPALLLLSVSLGLLSLDFLEQRKKTAIKVIFYFVAIIVGILLFYMNPAFQSMRQIADNDGAMNLGVAKYPAALIISCGTVLVMSLLMLKRYYNSGKLFSYLALKYISIYGVAAAALCLLQFFLLHFFSIGSNYAVKKYSLVIDTIFIIQLSILLAFNLKRIRLIDSIFANLNKKRLFGLNTTIIILAPVLILMALLHGQFVYEQSSKIVEYESDIQHLMKLNAHPSDNLIVKGTDKNTINYMLSIAILKTPREIAIPDVLLSNKINYTALENLVVIGDAKESDCTISHYGSASLLDAKCNIRLKNRCTQTFDLSGDELSLSNVLNSGFGAGEKDGRWSTENEAIFQCNNDVGKLNNLTINAMPFINNGLKKQRLKILVNGITKIDTSFDQSKIEQIVVPIDEFSASKKLTISFEMPDAKSPKELGINKNDGRKLGFFFTEINVK